jgi:hypothetical protein
LAVLKWTGSVQAPEVDAAPSSITRQADVSDCFAAFRLALLILISIALGQVHCLDSVTARAFECIVDLPSNIPAFTTVTKPVVSAWVELDRAIQPSLQVEELLWAEEICRADEKVVKACREVGVEPENLYVDGECPQETSSRSP